jgi:endoglucanase
VVKVPGLGSMLLPGKSALQMRMPGASTPAIFLLSLRAISPLWRALETLRETNLRLLLETAPKGFSRTGCNIRKTKAGS